jgi:hypothetical protein
MVRDGKVAALGLPFARAIVSKEHRMDEFGHRLWKKAFDGMVWLKLI